MLQGPPTPAHPPSGGGRAIVSGGGSVRAVRRILLSPSWWLRHLLMVLLVLVFLRLGWWQFEKGRSHDDLQNLFYGIEWPFFAGCVIFGWWRMMQEELRPPADRVHTSAPVGSQVPGSEVSGSEVPGSQVAGSEVRGAAADGSYGDDDDDDEEDEELADYNRYLAALHAHDQQRSGR
jgi:hypothetical protein